jgi:hypothetical protein
LRTAATLLLLTGTVFAVEIAELRNGFNIPHRSRETREGQVRLYLDKQGVSFVDVPSAEIARYTSEPDPEPTVETRPTKTTGQIVNEASEKQGVDSDFIRSVIRQESSGNANAVSKAGARGLMQLMPGTALQLGVKDSFSPEQNVHGGTLYLKELLDRYKGVPPYRETRQYVQRIVRDYNKSKVGTPKEKPAEKRKTGEPSQDHATVERASK